MIELWRQGTPVVLIGSSYAGHITEARIIGEGVLYLVAYFENGAYQEKWLYDCQFTTDATEKAKVGFKA